MPATMPARRRGTPLNHPLRLWREARDLSQQEVADACGISQVMVSYIEADKKLPWRESLACLCLFTGLPLDAFLRWREFMVEVGGEAGFLRKYARKGRPRKRPSGDGPNGA
jgi:transcriptional regulator with XRE-family HTH domain